MAGGIVIVIAITSLVVYFEVQDRRLEESMVRVERAQELIEQWEAADGSERESIEEEVRDILNDVIDNYSRLYSAQRALFVRGRLAFELEQWEEAAEDFGRVSQGFPQSHLALIALANQATAFEQSGNIERAMNSYMELSEKREERNPMRARALFSVGRLHEQAGDVQDALEAYEALVAQYSDSEWTNLARNRILAIETGVIGNQ